MKKKTFLFLFILGLFLCSKEGICHRVNVYAVLNGDTVEGEGGFGKGRPCISCEVIISDGEGNELKRDKTDQEGKFKVQVPQEALPKVRKVILEAGPGHRGEWEVVATTPSAEGAKESSQSMPPERGLYTEVAANIQESSLRKIVREEVRNALSPLAHELVALRESGPGITEIIGGIGYIFGIAGVILYLRSTKKR